MQEMEEWSGPVNYNTLFPVIKEESLSTRVRVVTNSAQINMKTGLAVNDCMWQGPNALADILDVLLHWRTVEVALM